MKLETFFEKFDQFADAPDAVAKMRELVLQLAVQGKLVERKENDGNAAKIFSEGLPPEAESRYETAENWIWIRFAAVGEQRLGKMLDQKGNRGELKPYLRNTNVQWMRFQLDDIKELRLESDELEEYRLLPGDLLICEGGEPGRCAIWRDPDREMYFQKAIHRVRPRKGILSEYLAICLQVDAQNGVLAKHFTGATIKHFTGRSLSEYSIPLPPLAEQKRIVAKVDELMALCDRLEAQQQERETRHAALARASLARFADAPTPANLPFLFHPSYTIPPADLRKSILTLAVQGKLVPQDPNDELPQIPSDGQTVGDSEWVSRLQLPDTWQWARFESLLAVLKNGFNGKPSKVVGKFKITRIETISRETVDLARVGYADDLPADVVAKHPVLKGDILFSHINSEPHLGKTAICTIDDPTLVHGVNLLLLRPIAGIDSRYLNIALRELRAAGYFVSIAQRAVNQASINQKNLGRTPIPIPPLAEQRRIVAKVEQLMALVDALETQLAASRATAANLLSALVAELTAA